MERMKNKKFLGYDADESSGKLIINRKQAPNCGASVSGISGWKTADYIKRIFEREGIKNWDGGTKWQATTLMSMLENEKYKGDALLQKKLYGRFFNKEADAE